MIDPGSASRTAEQAAYAAGAHLQASRSRLTEAFVTNQTPDEVARVIAAEALQLIRDVVLRRFPDHAFAAGPDRADDSPLDRPRWIVDAVSGLANYARGHSQYAVTIALMEAGEPQLGVVYDPCRNEFFGALRGRGAVLNGQPIECAQARRPLEAIAATVFPPAASPIMAGYVAEFGRVLGGFCGVRRSGSMALELAYLAAGRIDAFWAYDKAAQDAAAGIVLLRESGALVEARDGSALLRSHALMACTPSIREPFLALLCPA